MPRRAGSDTSKSPMKALILDKAGISNFMDTIDTTTVAKSRMNLSKAQLSVDSDDEHPDPEALAQFLESKTDFITPFALQREKLWQEKTRLSVNIACH